MKGTVAIIGLIKMMIHISWFTNTAKVAMYIYNNLEIMWGQDSLMTWDTF